MVGVRTPAIKQAMYDPAALLEEGAFTGHNKSRTGHHNDCFLAIEPASRPPLWRRLAPWIAAPLLVVLGWGLKPDSPVPEKQVSRWEISSSKGLGLYNRHRHGVDMSPDGTRLAFVSKSSEDPPWHYRIYIRHFLRGATIPLEVSGDVKQPFFSSDGKWLGVFWRSADGSERKLKKVPIDGGPSTTICDCDQAYGASWGPDDTIVFTCGRRSPLWRVSSSGGEPQQITELDRERGELSHRLPHFLPGGRAVLFTVVRHSLLPVDWSQAQIVVHSLESGEQRVLLENGSDARYVPTGHLVFAREATLIAVPFDLATLSVTGPQVPVLENVNHALYTGHPRRETGAAQFAFSDDSGSLAYIAGSVYPEFKYRVVRVDRKGAVERLEGIEPGAYFSVRLSPDQSKLALDRWYKRSSVWVYDLRRATLSPQTLEGSNVWPTWTLNGEGLVVASNRSAPLNLFLKLFDGVSEAERLFPSQQRQDGGSWSPDGTRLAFVQPKRDQQDLDIWILSMEDPRSAKPLLETRFQESHPAFSPNGRWLAYNSYESGRNDVYVRPYPGPGQRELISTNGGKSPAWSADGRELFYRAGRNGRRMMAVKMTVAGGRLQPGIPAALFEGDFLGTSYTRSYDVSQDGERFFMIQ